MICRYCHKELGNASASERHYEDVCCVCENKLLLTIAQSDAAKSLLAAAYNALSAGQWGTADAYYARVLEIEPQNGSAYLGQLLAELAETNLYNLKSQTCVFDDLFTYKMAMEYGRSETKDLLKKGNECVREKQKRAYEDSQVEERQKGIYGRRKEALTVRNEMQRQNEENRAILEDNQQMDQMMKVASRVGKILLIVALIAGIVFLFVFLPHKNDKKETSSVIKKEKTEDEVAYISPEDEDYDLEYSTPKTVSPSEEMNCVREYVNSWEGKNRIIRECGVCYGASNIWIDTCTYEDYAWSPSEHIVVVSGNIFGETREGEVRGHDFVLKGYCNYEGEIYVESVSLSGSLLCQREGG